MVAQALYCPFCESADVAESFVGSERYYGTGGSFPYNRCGECDSIYLTDRAIEVGQYYPPTFYAYAGRRSPLKAVAEAYVKRQGARFVCSLMRRSAARITRATKIVDVGCGSGELLRAFRSIGYVNVIGVDPYLPEGTDTGGIPVERVTVSALSEEEHHRRSAGIVMFHHSLEHVFDPAEDLRAARELLEPDGRIVVRIPIVGYAWRKYGTCWHQLDAPRHLALPSEKGMYALADRVGLSVDVVQYDSTEVMFIVSDAYVRGLSQVEAFPSAPLRTIARRIRTIPLRIRASHLNAKRESDQAAFVLRARR